MWLAAREMRPLGVVAAVFLALGVVMLGLRDPRPPAAPPTPPTSWVTPLELATLQAGPAGGLVLVDLSRAQAHGPLHLRDALRLDPGQPGALGQILERAAARPLARVVLVAEGEATPPPELVEGLKRAGRRVALLRGGAAAWQRDILAPQPPAGGDEAAQQDYRRRLAISQALQGRAAAAAPAPTPTQAPKLELPRQPRSGSSGC